MRIRSTGVAIVLRASLCFLWIGYLPSVHAADSLAPTSNPQIVLGVAGTKVSLPCNITPPSVDDAVALVLWYKDESTTPLYSLDARRGELAQARHAASDLLSARAYLSLSHRPATLQLEPLAPADDGLYRCRVDYRKGRTQNFDVILSVVVPPKKPVIMDQNGEVLQSLIGPYNEGDRLVLLCEAEGGKPPAAVTWWRESVLLDDTYEATPHGVVRNRLEIPALQRHDLMAVLTCQASNNNVSLPPAAYVTVDMNFRPTDVRIEGDRRPLSSGKPAELTCRSTGSRPPAGLSWWRGNERLRRAEARVSLDGYASSSALLFTPTPEDGGRTLACRAENPHITGSAIEDVWKLEVHYSPQLTLRLGNKLRHSHIQEGNDVYLECSVRANPRATEVGWRFEGRELHTNTSAGIIVSNQSLVLQRVKRHARGRYTCTAANTEGRGESEPLFLRVQYAPVCRPGQKTVYGAARHEAVRVACEVDADPREVTFRWEFNNSVERMDIASVASENGASTATYIPRTEFHYGALLCWGRNAVGLQRDPCVYTVVPAGPPDGLANCTVTNQSEDALRVQCEAGYDGGLRQTFAMELHDTARHRLQTNLSSAIPRFVARGLPSDTIFVVVLYAFNAKGRGKAFVLRANTLTGPESQTQRDASWQGSVNPILIVLVSLVTGLVIVIFIAVLVMKWRTRKDRLKDSSTGMREYKVHAPARKENIYMEPGKSPGEEKCPDVIPGQYCFADLQTSVSSEKDLVSSGYLPSEEGRSDHASEDPLLEAFSSRPLIGGSGLRSPRGETVTFAPQLTSPRALDNPLRNIQTDV